MFLRSARERSARFENCLQQNAQSSETYRLNWNANSRRRKGVVPFGSQPMRAKWRLCTMQQSGFSHAWKHPTCNKGDSRTAFWLTQKSEQLKAANARKRPGLADRREASSIC